MCELKIGVGIVLVYSVEFNESPNYFVTVDKIERGIRNVLDKDGEERNNVKED